MFLLGTLVPLVALDSTARDIFQSLVGVIDLFGIYYAIKLVYWSGARQYEFDW